MTGSRPHDAVMERVMTPDRPPMWLVWATGALGLAVLGMAVAETNLWIHYLIDGGEYVSLAGLVFILGAGVALYARQRLLVSLPLSLPWLLFPVITQGDQLIDNLSITWMRIIVHVLLAAIFATPVFLVVLGARYGLAPSGAPRRPGLLLRLVPGLAPMAEGRVREGSAYLATFLFLLLTWVAVQFLGQLMVITLIVMGWAALVWGSGHDAPAGSGRRRSERFALALLIAGVVVSFGLYIGYKNRPGAYQGSPAYYMDPAQQDSGFRLDRVPVPPAAPAVPAEAAAVEAALTTYARAFERLLSGYYILDRNYNYDFHNRLFLRSTPLLANYRSVGLTRVAEAERLRQDADGAFAAVRATLAPDDPLAALLDDVRAYADFNFGRAPTLERMSGGFEQTQAGLQHATHLFEGEGKVFSERLGELLDKHAGVLAAPALEPVVGEFTRIGREVQATYADRIVGF
ncbi:MAG: hypothetical protein AB7G23_07380 [Vicinamibacterales bacterium]